MTGWILGGVLAAALFMSPILGYLASPWSPFWLRGSNAIPPPIIVDQSKPPVDPLDLAPIQGHVTDSQRYQLARMAGWNVEDAILATAISIAENGSGSPAALSGRNSNGTFDLGLWQVNTIWWAQFGGQVALIDPWRNAQAAYYIKGRQGWCAWSTYLASCGPGHTGSFAAFLARAQAAAKVQPPPGQA
jgi:Lysozyme like domain